MVIFHSYVSLPEGNQLLLFFNVCSFFGGNDDEPVDF